MAPLQCAHACDSHTSASAFYEPPMRIDVAVPGIRKERGKLPAPATLRTPWLAVPLAAGPPICELVGPTLREPVTGGEVGAAIESAHPVSAKTGKSAPIRSPVSRSTGSRLYPVLGRSVLLRPSRMRGVELPVTLFDAAGSLVPRKRSADMVWAGALACSGNFLLRLAGCQSKNPIAEV